MEFWNVFYMIKQIGIIILFTAAAGGVVFFLMFAVGIVILAFILIIFILWNLFDRRGKPPIGYRYRELPMDTVTIEFSEYDSTFSLGYNSEKELRKKSQWDLEDSWTENQQTIDEIQKEFAAILADKDPCLFDTWGCWADEYPPETYNEDKIFELDAEELKVWLDSQEKVINHQGRVIAVRGIDESTINELWKLERAVLESGDGAVFELIIPDAQEKTLCKMKQEDIWIYQDIKNCKFKIINGFNGKCHFRYSETPGYTKTDMIQKAKEFAERKGYKFKIIE